MTEKQQAYLKIATRILATQHRRLIGMSSAMLNATKNADRLVLANSIDSIKLEIDAARSYLATIIDIETRDGNLEVD